MPPRGIRTYVDIVVRVSADGTELSRAIVLPDGRAFEVTRVTSKKRLQGGWVYAIQIGEHMTSLYKDAAGWSGERWFVVMRVAREG
ncbi:hypothetical protein [[Collinsella] massiliensis]|uniref:hypothetical protein n=1 Tax=[Collinsella] massiliensis TaxID=1232426 RepID=UPI001F131BA0|nr:hypothetical protein [[Collinsella] massiliensis]